MGVRETLDLDAAPYRRELAAAASDTERASRTMRAAFGEAASGTQTLGSGADTLKAKLSDVAAAGAGLAAIIGVRLTNGLKGLTGFIRGAVVNAFDVTALGALGIARGLRRVATEAEESEGALRHLAPAANVAASGLETVATIAIRVSAALTGMKIAAAAAAAAIAVAGFRAAAGFVPAWNRVLTLIEGTPQELNRLRDEVNALAGDLGVAAPEALEAFYQVLSAMPELTKDPRRALEVLRATLKVSSTGFAESSEAAAALTSIMNSFGLEAERAEEVADKLFATQDVGETTFGELAASIGRVGPLVAALNGGLDDMLALVAALTKSGTDTNVVFTQLRATIANVIKPSADAAKAANELGIEFNAAAIESQGLAGFLLDIIRVTEGNPDLIARLFGSTEAQALLIGLSAETEQLATNIEAIGNAAGSTDAKVEQMNDSWQAQRRILGEQLRAELRQLGFDFERMGTAGVRALNDIVQGARDAKAAVEDFLNFLASGNAARELFGRLRPPEIEGTIPELPGIDVEVLGPIARPELPLSPEFSQERIQEIERLSRARAVAHLARTGDEKAYRVALRETDRAVNRVIISEMERLRAGGVAEEELAKLASSYRVVRAEVQELDRATQQAADRLADITLQATTTALERQAMELDRIERELGRGATPEQRAQLEGARGRIEGARELAAITEEADALGRAANVTNAEILPLLVRLEKLTSRETLGIDALETARRLWGELALRMTDAERAGADVEKQFEGIVAEPRAEFDAARADIAIDAARGLITPEQAEEAGREAAERFNAALLDTLADLEAAGTITAGLRVKIAGALEDTGAGAKTTAENVAAIADELEGVLRGALAVLDVFGALDDSTRRLIQGAIDLAAGIGSIASGNIIGGLTQAIGGVTGFVSGLFGESPEEDAHRQRLREGADALERLKTNVDDLSAALSGLTGTTLVNMIEAIDRSIEIREQGFNQGLGKITEDQLAAFGLNLDQAKAIAASLGIELDLSITGLKIFRDALREIEFEDFFRSFGGQEELRELRLDAADIEDPAERLKSQVDAFLAAVELPDDLEAQLRTAKPEDIGPAILAIIDALESGALDVADLGGLTVDEFVRTIGKIEQLGDEAEEATTERTNRSVQFASTITEFQANEVIAWLEDIALTLRQIRDGGGFEAVDTGDTTRPPPDPRELDIRDALAFIEEQDARVLAALGSGALATPSTGQLAAGVVQLSSGALVDLSGATLTFRGTLTDRDFREIGEWLGDALRERNRQGF